MLFIARVVSRVNEYCIFFPKEQQQTTTQQTSHLTSSFIHSFIHSHSFLCLYSIMKAAQYSSFSSPIEIKNIPRPTLSSPSSSSSSSDDEDAVILQVLATGVCRSDWHGWKGHDDDIKQHGLPFTPGHELSGVIVEKGSKVGANKNVDVDVDVDDNDNDNDKNGGAKIHMGKSLEIGDRVAVPFILSCGHCAECNVNSKPTVCLHQEQPGFTLHGSFAEYVKIPRAERNLRHIPDGVGFVEAAALGCRFTTAFRAVVQQGLCLDLTKVNNNKNTATDNNDNNEPLASSSWWKRKKVVAIFGCGGLGLSCIMIGKAFQSEGNITSIIAVDISTKALKKAKELGADYVINANDLPSSSSVKERVLELTNGMGAEISIDAAGFTKTCENALHCTRRGCRMVQVGLPIGSTRPPQIDMGLVAAREIEIVGSHGFAAVDLPSLLNLVKAGRLDVKKLIEKEVTLEEGVQALMNMDNESPLGMTMITKFGISGPCKL